MTIISFFSNNKNLKLAFIARKHTVQSDISKPAFVFLSGYRSDMRGTKASFVDELSNILHFDYLRFDYSGHGESEGIFTDLTLTDWIDDSVQIIQNVFGTERPIIVIGSSMGAWIGIKLFEKLQNPIPHFIALAPAPDFSNILMKTQRELPIFQEQLQTQGFVRQKCDYEGMDFIITQKFLTDADTNAVLDKPIMFNGGVHIIQGMQDTDVPYRHALLLAEKMTSKNIKIELLKSSNHRLSEPTDLECLKQAIVNVLKG